MRTSVDSHEQDIDGDLSYFEKLVLVRLKETQASDVASCFMEERGMKRKGKMKDGTW